MSRYYDYQCGGCVYFDFQGDNEKGYCSWYKTYYWPGETCDHQKPRNYSSGCYITTIVCDILGKEDDCEVLENMRKLRSEYLQKDERFSSILMEYDYVGPEIAGLINKEFSETQDKEVWQKVYDNYLVRTCELVKENNFEEATNKYIQMVNSLKDYLGIKQKDITVPNYDYTTGGHGYIKK